MTLPAFSSQCHIWCECSLALTGYTATSWSGMRPASPDSLHTRLNVDQVVLSKDFFLTEKIFCVRVDEV